MTYLNRTRTRKSFNTNSLTGNFHLLTLARMTQVRQQLLL